MRTRGSRSAMRTYHSRRQVSVLLGVHKVLVNLSQWPKLLKLKKLVQKRVLLILSVELVLRSLSPIFPTGFLPQQHLVLKGAPLRLLDFEA